MKTLNAIIGITGLAFALGTMAAENTLAPVKPFNGKDLTGWVIREGDKATTKWVVGTPQIDPADPTKMLAILSSPNGTNLVNLAKEHDIYTEEKFGDCIVKCEVMFPKNSNSGIYLMGEYEVQVEDSYGKPLPARNGYSGAIYGTVAPKDPMYLKPGEWNTFEIHFQAPRFDADGKKTANAKFIKIVMNGSVVIDNAEAPKPTGTELTRNEVARGPLLLQGNHGPVAFRNIEITPLN